MPRLIMEWKWEEAFDKFGFGDGDFWNATSLVSQVVDKMGYWTECDSWGIHNYMIMDIKKDKDSDESILFNPDANGQLDDWKPEVLQRIKDRGYEVGEALGYMPPRAYLPDDILAKLDEVFDDEFEEYD